MSENCTAAAAAIYNDMVARPDFYKEEWGFDPLRYLRESADEEGRTELSLDVKFRKHWFRLVYPTGKIAPRPVDVNERFAIFKAKVYADRNDPEENFLAEGTAIRYNGGENAKAYERYYVDWAETIAIGRALSNAGFDVPWCNMPLSGGDINPYTGEVADGEQNAAPPPRQYSSVTAPPGAEQPQQPAAAQPAAPTPALQQAQASAAPTPALQQAQPPAAPTPALQQAQPPAVPTPAAQPAPAAQPRSLEEAMQTMSVEQAKALTVNFGQNAGKTLGQIAIDNPKDLDWLANKFKGNFMLKAGAQILINAALQRAN